MGRRFTVGPQPSAKSPIASSSTTVSRHADIGRLK
jgi:hypothetical protein